MTGTISSDAANGLTRRGGRITGAKSSVSTIGIAVKVNLAHIEALCVG
jgi:hypothetical protein